MGGKKALDAGHIGVVGEPTRDSIQLTAHPPAREPTREIIESAGGSLDSPLDRVHVQPGAGEPHAIQCTIPHEPASVTGNGLLQQSLGTGGTTQLKCAGGLDTVQFGRAKERTPLVDRLVMVAIEYHASLRYSAIRVACVSDK